MKVAIVKYNAGNIYSVVHALRRLGVEPVVTDDPEALSSADKVIFPGVGEASTTMEYLKRTGLDQVILSLKQPVLGICLGMQLMCHHSEEGDVDCLGLFNVEVKRFDLPREYKIPHMGWNQIHDLKTPLFGNIRENDFVYFVHGYYVPVCTETIATSDYPAPFSAALHKDNFYATQFHPEKSGDIGSAILSGFLSL
ncbi:MAG: imidazole glycerol phosphate synthase subunit HisH [Paludibacteraceae bacterium]|nr:imidazole glycerol phosphate synthase subunit HisH [Paludibacteraceae bacterium]